MKRIMLLVVCLFVLFTSGCSLIPVQSSLTQLSAPEITLVEDGLIRWNSISNCDAYIVKINTFEERTTGTSFSISSLMSESGSVVIKVKALGNGIFYSDSDWSAEYNYDYQVPDSTPTDDTNVLTGVGQSINVVEAGYVDSIIYDAVFDRNDLAALTMNETDPDDPSFAGYYSETSMSDFYSTSEVVFKLGSKSMKETKKKFTQNGFGAAVSVNANYHQYSSQFYFTSYEYVFTKVLSMPEYATNMDQYYSMLSDNFLSQVEYLSSNQVTDDQIIDFFKQYGTHIITSAVFGGGLQAYYSICTNEKTFDMDIKIELEKYTNNQLKDKLSGGSSNWSLGIEEEFGLSSATTQTSFYATFKGGDIINCSNETALAESFSEWTSSFNNASDNEKIDKSVIVAIRDGGLYPIWELISTSYPDLADRMQSIYNGYSDDVYNEYMGKFAYLATEISTPEDLEMLRTNPGGHYVLTAPIDLSGEIWTPLPDFTGILDGDGYSISNFTVAVPGVDNPGNKGFFTSINESGIVKNLVLDDITISGAEYQSGTYIYVGSLAGTSDGEIDNVDVTGTSMALNRGTSSLGGIVGSNSGEILDSSVIDSTLFNNGDVAGIAGVSSGLIKDCIVGGLYIIHWGSQTNYTKSVGGIVGFNTGTVENSGTDTPITMEYKGTGDNIFHDICPKMGFVVGDNASSGVLSGIFHNSNDKKYNTGGCDTKYFFQVNYQKVGKNDNGLILD